MPRWSVILQRFPKAPGSNYARHTHFIAFLKYSLCPEKQTVGFLNSKEKKKKRFSHPLTCKINKSLTTSYPLSVHNTPDGF